MSNKDKTNAQRIGKACLDDMDKDIECPFCEDEYPDMEYDLIGLARHLMSTCEGLDRALEDSRKEGKAFMKARQSK